jgi:hypothetical protein
MKYFASIYSEAEEDKDSAFVWYEQKQIGLGVSFYNSLSNAVTFICKNPFSCPVIYKDFRRLVIQKFPFGLYYRVNVEHNQ